MRYSETADDDGVETANPSYRVLSRRGCTSNTACDLFDRLGRSLRDLITMLDGLRDRGVEFRSLTEAIDTERQSAAQCGSRTPIA
jgi:hypothetical protein